jgi:hypothetical protein
MKSDSLWHTLVNFPRDCYRLLGSGLFAHTNYAQLYFKSKFLRFLSLPHYVLFGEKHGCRPNAFFDPAYFAQRSGTRRLVDYLDQQPLWAYPTSDYFDSRWYIDRYSAILATSDNPLQHFWSKGFDMGLNPSPRFDMQFFLRAIARDRADRRDYAYEYLCACSPDTPLNIAELEKRQSDFHKAIKFETLKRIGAPQRRYLVFVQSGRNFVPDYHYKTALFDTLINYYDLSTRVSDEVQYVFRQNGTKTTAVKTILERCPEVLLGYDAVLLLDDDVVITQQQVEALFAAREKHQLDLVQASLTEDSECFFPVLKQPLAGKGLRQVSGIEIMMPVVSRRALQVCGWVFGECISGWGVDNLLSTEVRKRFGDTIALLGDVVCVHVRSVDTSHGALYTYLKQHGLEPTVEAGKIAMKFGLNDKMSAVHFREGLVSASRSE